MVARSKRKKKAAAKRLPAERAATQAMRGVGLMNDDPDMMPLDLTKDEKLRATALILAIRYHVETIVKEGALYTAMKAGGAHLTPTTVHKVIIIALEFAEYLRDGTISVKYAVAVPEPPAKPEPAEASAGSPAPGAAGSARES